MTRTDGLRVGVIGLGFGARVVAPVFRETSGCEVADVVSPRDEVAVTALCSRPDVDLISVQSPPFMHLQHVRRAVEAGKAVLCDKPFGRNLAQAEEMFKLASEAGVVNFVNFEFRRHPARQELRSLIRGGTLGQVDHLQWNAFHGVWRDPSRRYGWSFDRDLGGGWIRLSGSHTIDFLRWTFGDISEATATTRTTITHRADADGQMRKCTAEDCYTALLRTESGVSITIDATSTNPVERPNRVVVIGSQAVLELTNDNPREEDARIVLHDSEGPTELFSFSQANTYMTQMKQWTEIVRDSVIEGRAHPEAPTFADGLACSRVMNSLYRSAACHATLESR